MYKGSVAAYFPTQILYTRNPCNVRLNTFGALLLSAIGSAEAQLWRVLAGETSSNPVRPASGVERVYLAR